MQLWKHDDMTYLWGIGLKDWIGFLVSMVGIGCVNNQRMHVEFMTR